MTNNTIITIGREFGSGGHEIGNRLSERLDIPLYDQNLIKMAAKELQISDEEAQVVDETILGKFLSAYVVSMGDYTTLMGDKTDGEPLSDRVYRTQTMIIKKLADRSPCIFVGRCADFILSDYANCLNAFVHASKEDRMRRIMSIYNLSEKKALDKMRKIDRERQLYYEAHTGRAWGSADSHQMVFNASLMGIEGVVDALAALYEQKK